jgi:signal transduction histidine kinase
MRAAVNLTSMVDRLAALPALAHVPREQLQWLVDHGELRRLDDGGTIRGSGSHPLGLFVLISGRFSVRVDQDGVERELREVTPGRITGHLPYSRMTTPRGYLVADGPVEFLAIQREDLEEMTRECYEFTASCVQEMLARVRTFKADDKRQEKMAALGRLSAGLAHELNNPASAVARAAAELDAARAEVVAASRALGAAGFDGDSMAAIRSLEVVTQATPPEQLSAVGRADLEDRVMDWLDAHGVDPDLGYPLVEHGLTVPDLDAAAAELDDAHLAVVLRYVAANATARGLSAQISSAAARIHSLVAAVKKHTHMDRAPAVEPVILADHIRDTVALMSGKASLKDLSVELSVEADLPPVAGSVADLNQVWMHLLDNAIDAVAESGRISIDVAGGNDAVFVRFVDDGPGIPIEDQERVFEPFFTTKDLGQGRGLGLDVVRTVVRSHKGHVELRSRPGRTEFCVTLPAAGAPDGSGAQT